MPRTRSYWILIDPMEADEGGSNEQETDEMGEDLVGYVL